MDLLNAVAGDRMKVVGYHVDKNGDLASSGYRQSLLAMGLVPGAQLEIIRRAPLGDPLLVRIGQFELSLRQSEVLRWLKLEKCPLQYG